MAFPVLDTGDKDSTVTLSGGGLIATKNATNGAAYAFSTHGKESGKWRFQVTVTAISGDNSIGITGGLYVNRTGYLGQSNGIGINSLASTGVLYNGVTQYAYSTTNMSVGDVFDVYVDADAGKAWFARNGTILNGDPVAGTGGTSIPSIAKAYYPTLYLAGANTSFTINFGATAFTYTGSAGYSAWSATAPPATSSVFRSFALLVRSVGFFAQAWAETELMTTSGGTNMLSGSTGSASVTNIAGDPASNTIDANTTTFGAWTTNGSGASAQAPIWVAYDLGSSATRSAAYFAIRGRDGGGGGQTQAPTLFDLWYSTGAAATGAWYRGLSQTGLTFAAFAATTPGQRQEQALVGSLNAYSLPVTAGVYSLSGTAVGLTVGRRLLVYNQLIPGLTADGHSFIDLSGWTVSGLTLTLVNGTADLVDTSGSGVAYRAIAVTAGKPYTLQGYLIDTTAPMGMAVGTTPGGQELGSVLSFANGIIFTSSPVTNPGKSITFTAPLSGVVYVSMFLSTTGHGHAGYLRLEDRGFYSLVGTNITLTKGGPILSVAPGTYALNGSAVALTVQRRLPVDPGVYTQFRTPVSLLLGRRFSITPGVYALTGSDTVLAHITGRFVTVDSGVYVLRGADVGMLVGHKLAIDPATYALAGSAVNFVYRRNINVVPGAYVLNGTDVKLLVGYRLKVAPGVYSILGSDISLVCRRLVIDPGVYALQGANVQLLVGKNLHITPGVYTVAGSSIGVLLSRRLSVAPGVYALTGANVALRVSRRLSVAPGVYSITGSAIRLSHGYTARVTPGVYTLTGSAVRFIAARTLSVAPGVYRITPQDIGLKPTYRPRGPRAIAVGIPASRYASVEPHNRRVVVDPQSRYVSVEPAPRRYAAVEPRDKEVLGGSMLKWPEKDPDEVLDYELDWADPTEPRLEVGETLTSSVWSVLAGDVVISTNPASSYTPQGLATVWLTGGTANTKCILLDRVTTSKGRTYEKEVSLRIREH